MTNVVYILGPVVIAVLLNVLIFGVCILQFSTYYTAGFSDRLLIKILVIWVLLLDTVHVSASVYLLWNFVVSNFANFDILTSAPWPFSFTPMMTSLHVASCPIQVFLAWRIHQFAKSRMVLLGILMLSFAQFSTGVATAIQAIELNDILRYKHLVSIVDAWLGSAVVCDISITVLLWYHLSKSRTGFAYTDGVITRLIRSSVETAAFGTFFCIMNLVTFTVSQDTNFHAIFAFPLGRIYTNTLLMTLNSRKVLRSELRNNVHTQTSFPVFARPVPVATVTDVLRSLPIFPQGIQSYRLDDNNIVIDYVSSPDGDSGSNGRTSVTETLQKEEAD